MDFKNKVVLITGAGSGIGKTAAIAYADLGAKVVVSDINVENGNQTNQFIHENGGSSIFVEADVSKQDQVKNLIKSATTTFGGLDIAINNAGIGAPRSRTPDVKEEHWDKVIAVNQTGTFYCMQEELKVMAEKGHGNIVNIASIAGLRGLPMQIAYTASKHAVVGMTKAAALEYTRQPIRINAICPVFTKSPLLDQLIKSQEDIETKLIRTIPMRRFGKASEIVNAILWISSDQASFVTGLAFPIDGGQLA